MKIKTVSISNILSFASKTDVETSPDITFDTHGTEGSLHILIGPNGSGKSNFVEIITHCFRRALFIPIQLLEQNLMTEQKGGLSETDRKQTIRIDNNQKNVWSLARHRQYQKSEQHIVIAIELNDNDINNLYFLLDHKEIINGILARYSSLDVNVPGDVQHDQLKQWTELVVRVSPNNNQEVMAWLDKEVDSGVNFIKRYLQYFELFQHAITIYNRYQRPTTDTEWPSLKQTFALLGSHRNYARIGGGVPIESSRSLYSVHQRIRDESTRGGDGQEPAVFELVKRKIGYRFYDLYLESSLSTTLENLYKEEPLASINRSLQKYLGLMMKIRKLNPIDPALEIYFVRETDVLTDVAELSSGEKGILHFIFTLYGYDLENGVIVIDEPELHLHPQIQREYLDIIEDIKRKLDIQFVVVTHSPIFVTKDTIGNVYRFNKIDGETRIIKPTIEEPQKTLAKILDLTNSAKMFFVNKAILVEGETDEYFWRYYLDQLKRQSDGNIASWAKQIADFEIFNIEGKGKRMIWSEFLKKFGLQVSYVGDWDNIGEIASVNIQSYEQSYTRATVKASSEIKKKGSLDGVNLVSAVDKYLENPSQEHLATLRASKDYIVSRHVKYPALIKYIRSDQPQEWSKIEHSIELAYASRVYILKRGELEDYLLLNGKGLDRVIKFCQSGYGQWVLDPAYIEHRRELEKIAKTIFT